MLITKEHFDKIYKNNNIDTTCLVLILNNYCNANCKVCLAQQIFKSSLCEKLCEYYSPNCIRCCDHNAPDEIYYERLKGILKTINSPNVNIIITGGEPTLSNRFIPVLKILDMYNYNNKTIELETNGAKLLDEEIAKELIKRNVFIHLSRYCIDDTKNYDEFKFKFAETSNEKIKQLALKYGKLLGLSSILLKKYIPDAAALTKFVDYYKDYGIHQFSFLEVMIDTDLPTANKTQLDYCLQQLIPSKELSEQLSQMGHSKIKDFGDESYKYRVHTYKDCILSFTMSNLHLQHNQPEFNEFSRFLIMPSGEIGVNGIEIR